VLLVRLAVAACVLLVGTACGVGHSSSEDVSLSLRTASPTAAAERSDYRSAEDAGTRLGNGVTLMVSAPRSFTPTDTAYPRAARAVAFDMVIENEGNTAYRPAQLSFVATVNGAVAEQVIDSTQGYTGVVGAIDEVLPNQNLRFAVAFGVPVEPCSVRVEVRPDTVSTDAIPIYDGTA
jgi:hypothetical protein